ncbi:MAG: hypothetical protein JW863_07835 [Chitinispirillaceae bacterium]|nr:hypothetical protein [Chitinispirillaceae bacterium]
MKIDKCQSVMRSCRIWSLCLAVVVSLGCLHCSMGVKRIGNYRDITRNIRTVTCAASVNYLIVNDDPSRPPRFWELTPSEHADSVAMKIIHTYVNRKLRRKFTIDYEPFQPDSSSTVLLSRMFNQLENTDAVESYRIPDEAADFLTRFSSRFIILVCQSGYHFSEKYIDAVEGREAAQQLLGIAALGTAAVAGTVGIARFDIHDKGYFETALAFIDREEKKVLYFARRRTNDNPFADSTMIRHLSSMFVKF